MADTDIHSEIDTRPAGESADKSIGDIVGELWEMAVAYARQETVEPIKGLGRFLAWGVPGALAIAVGSVLVGLGGLRALQTETGKAFSGSLSFLPYVIVLAVFGAIAGFLATRIGKGKPS